MPAVLAKRVAYTRAEYVSDLIVHITGVVAVTAAVPVLIALSLLFDGNPTQVAATSVYGLGLVSMIVCSALYNIFPHAKWEWLFRRLDHSAIFLKIAGTYTAFVLIAGHGFALAAGLWAAAAAGISLKILWPTRWPWFCLTLYLGMGWVAAVFGQGVFAALPVTVVWLIATGGSLYTLGVVFYLWDRLPHHMTVWHVFVLSASLTIYAGVVVAVVI